MTTVMAAMRAARVADRRAHGRDAERVLLVVVGDAGGADEVELLEQRPRD